MSSPASVPRAFDVTWTTRAGEKESLRHKMSLADLRRTLPAMLDAAPAERRNVIVRPHGPDVTFALVRYDHQRPKNFPGTPLLFLALETSPGNFQRGRRSPATRR